MNDDDDVLSSLELIGLGLAGKNDNLSKIDLITIKLDIKIYDYLVLNNTVSITSKFYPRHILRQ